MALSDDFQPEPFFTPVLIRLEECLRDQLAQAHGPDLCYLGIQLGAATPPLGVLKANCGGVAWIRPGVVTPSSSFPPAEDLAAGLADRLAMQIEVGVARGYPRATDGMYHDPAEIRETTRLVMSDMQRSRAAIVCCSQQNPGVGFALGQWLPLDVSGATAGGAWTAWVGVR